MPIVPAAFEVLTALQPVLERWGPWYLFGAQAVVAHGCPRLSADVDVTDARSLWRLKGAQMDATRVLSVLRLLEEALGQSDLVPVFDSIRSG